MPQTSAVASDRFDGLLRTIVAMSTELSLDRALQRIVDAAADVAAAEYGFLGVFDGLNGRRIGTYSVHGMNAEEFRQLSRLPQGDDFLRNILHMTDPIRIQDLRSYPDVAAYPELHTMMCSFIGVPIRVKNRTLGHLYLTNKVDGDEFTVGDEQALQALASAAGVVIQNAQLYDETERQRNWLEAGAEITQALLNQIGRAQARRLVVEKARVVGAADVAAMVVADDLGRLRVRAVSGVQQEVVGDIIEHEECLDRVVRDLEASYRVVEEPEGLVLGPEWPGLAALQCVPFVSVDGRGALLIAWPDPADVPADIHHLDHLTTYVEQASLVLQVARAQDDQARLAVYEDRDRIGRDLHDLVIQRLFAVGLSLEGMTRTLEGREVRSRIDQAVNDLDRTIKDIRRTIFDLGHDVESAGLRIDLEQVVDEAAKLLGFFPEVTMNGKVDTVPDAVASHLLRVVREQLSNIVRHAGASKVTITLECSNQIELTIRDDGRGHQGDSEGRGLHNMQHRARQLGGVCRVDTQPGEGFTLWWAVPKEHG